MDSHSSYSPEVKNASNHLKQRVQELPNHKAPFTPVPAPSFSSSKCFVCAVKTCGPVEMLHIKGLQPHMATQLEKENVALIAHPAAVTERCLTEVAVGSLWSAGLEESHRLLPRWSASPCVWYCR
ncbi:uncharacterized protein [Anas platyrhynchos]|uniref:uncharacterized protein n=1 Tax=Anas platyrhynchos TaxID=8839 RepID=UPI003AF2E157